MKSTIFTTPILSPILRMLSNTLMRLAGWRVQGGLPDLKKYVMIGAPHTSNWDFVLFLGVIFFLKINARYMGKIELFRSPIGWFFYWCGGIPVDRKKSTGLVEQTIEACSRAEDFKLVIAPEGTRHGVREWKTGFYRIAIGAGIPIVMVKLDGKNRIIHLREVFQPSGEMEADMKVIKEYYAGARGVKANRQYITLEQ